MLTGLEYQHLLCVTVDTIVKLLNISSYIVLNMTANDHRQLTLLNTYGTMLKLMDLHLINYTLLLHLEAMTLLQGKKIHLSSLHCLTF